MTVTYAPPLMSSDHGFDRSVYEALTEGPAFARTRRAGRWHRVRSAYNRLDPWRDDIVTVVSYWCGPSGTTLGQSPVLLVDEHPAIDPRCGTCEGRYWGWVRDHGLIFEPRVSDRPKLCPGTRSKLVRTVNHRAGECLVCGDLVAIRGCGGPYFADWCVQSHGPGPGLIDPCPFHGWKLLRVVDGEARCSCGQDGRS